MAAALSVLGLATLGDTARGAQSQKPRSALAGLLDRNAMAGKGAAVSLGRKALDAVTRKWFENGAKAQVVVEQQTEPGSGDRQGELRGKSRNGTGRIDW